MTARTGVAVNQKSERRFALVLSGAAVLLSAFFPGLGFLVYLAARGRLSNLRKGTLIVLVVLEVAYLITALGTMYGPVISTIGAATSA
jgi:hypothetical protein